MMNKWEKFILHYFSRLGVNKRKRLTVQVKDQCDGPLKVRRIKAIQCIDITIVYR